MKHFIFSLFVILFISTFSSYVFALGTGEVEYHGYFRSGIGNNSKGGDQVCFTNPGAGSNEFRVGNECSTYGEISFVGHHLKKKNSDSPYFKSNVLLAFEVETHQDWEANQNNTTQTITLDSNGDGNVDTSDAPSVDTDNGDIPAFREVYLEGGNFDGSPLSFWVGKRFYREKDIFMNDYYYFADLSGPGAGIGNIPFFLEGSAHFAYLKRIDSSTSTNIGSIPLNIFDLRLKDMKLTDKDSIQLWLAYGDTPSARGTSNNTLYSGNTGQAFGALWQHNLPGGFNHFSIIYGKGLLDGLNVWGSLLTEVESSNQTEQDASNRLRVANHTTLDVNSNLALHAIALYERRDNGSNSNNIENWYSIGVQPVYRFSDHYQFVSVLGTSIVDADAASPRKLTRLTLAPQVSAGKSIWARPVIRLFYTRSWWNAENKNSINSDVYANETSGGSWGVQGEVWF